MVTGMGACAMRAAADHERCNENTKRQTRISRHIGELLDRVLKSIPAETLYLLTRSFASVQRAQSPVGLVEYLV
jgi:hypothetical protein